VHDRHGEAAAPSRAYSLRASERLP
jgi:hypothetical protein